MFEQDYDKIMDRELNKYLDEKYPADVSDAADTLQTCRDEEILNYLEGLKDEPAIDALLGTMDNFGLSSDQISAYVKRWIDRAV